jgi:hypothetical protein
MLINNALLELVYDIFEHASVAITGDVYGHVAPDVSISALVALAEGLNE